MHVLIVDTETTGLFTKTHTPYAVQISYAVIDTAGECLDLANTLSEFWFHPGHPDRNAALAHMSHVCSTARTTRELYELLWTVPAQ